MIERLSMTYTSDIIQAPYDAVMPLGLQTGYSWALGVAVLILAVMAVRQSLRHGSLLPLLFLVAGAITIPLEPLVAYYGHAIHPIIGQFVAFKSADRAIPWHVVAFYIMLFGGFFITMYDRLLTGNFSTSLIWKTYFTIIVLDYAFEIHPLLNHFWIYYEPQALRIWEPGEPLFWAIMNAECCFVALTLIKICMPIMRGWKQLLVLALSPMGAIAGYFGAGFPYFIIANSSAANNQMIVEISGILSAGLAMLTVYICSRLLVADTSRLLTDARVTRAKG